MTRVTYERLKVYDIVLRLIHAWNALAISGLLCTAWASGFFEPGAGQDTLWRLHVQLGNGLLLGVVARLVWGFVGPGHARLGDLWHPRSWWRAIRHLELRAPTQYGHDPAASGAYLLFYGIAMIMGISGLGLAAVERNLGPLAGQWFDNVWLEDLFRTPHALGHVLIPGFIALHLGAMILHECRDRIPILQSMFSGFQYRHVENRDAHSALERPIDARDTIAALSRETET